VGFNKKVWKAREIAAKGGESLEDDLFECGWRRRISGKPFREGGVHAAGGPQRIEDRLYGDH